MPNTDVGEQLRLSSGEVHTLECWDVGLTDGQEQVLKVLGVSSQPVLWGIKGQGGYNV